MKKEFIESIQENLRYLGFGEARFNEELEEEMERGAKEFQLTTEAHFDDDSKVEATLHFRRAENDEKYFFIRYDASLTYPDDPGYRLQQTFYIHKGSGVTFKESFNLLEGRSVYKNLTNLDEEKYSAWIQLDFTQRTPDCQNYKVRQFRDQYGYNLERVLMSYPIQELTDEALKENLIRSLKKGNLHGVTFVKDTKKEKMFIAACPEFKTITICSQAVRHSRLHLLHKVKKNLS
ncbi:MAG: hypothetical protein J0H74_03820 [Chitinophagaceae bacterium]|nr:hypothetical protein [Chitinophagaceae bacterium]